MSRDYKIAGNKIEIIPHLICLKPTFEKINFDENYIFKAKNRLHLNGKKVVLFFGYIRPTKGIEYIIYALPSIIKKFPNLVFLIIGRAKQSYHDYFDYIHQLVEEVKLSVYVRFENYVSEELLQHYFIASDLVVFPYVMTAGTTPIAYIKAVEFGKPIIATDIEPFSQLFVDHENCLLVPPRNSHALSESIIELLSNKTLSTELSINVTKNFSQNCRKKSIEKILKIYHDVIQHKKKY